MKTHLEGKQKEMVIERLRSRMTTLGFSNEIEYIQYYVHNSKSEFHELVSLFSPLQSTFFSEMKQFEFLAHRLLPGLLKKVRTREDKVFRMWVAACGRGHEVYSCAIFLEQLFKELAPDLKFQICGTDTDVISMEFAKNAIFLKKEIDSVPMSFQNSSFISIQNEDCEYARIHPRLHQLCSFQTANLTNAESWPRQMFDLTICRNAFSSMSLSNVEQAISGFQSRLTDGGGLFFNASDCLPRMGKGLKPVGPGIYIKVT